MRTKDVYKTMNDELKKELGNYRRVADEIESLQNRIKKVVCDVLENDCGLSDFECTKPEPLSLNEVRPGCIGVKVIFQYDCSIDLCKLNLIKDKLGAADIWVHADRDEELSYGQESAIWLNIALPLLPPFQ